MLHYLAFIIHPFSFLLSPLAFIYWDPPRNIFTIPLINRPIAWYGLLFTLGFIVGYFLLIRIIKRKLDQTHTLTERDIASWSSLIKKLQNTLHQPNEPYSKILKSLDSKTKNLIAQSKLNQEPDVQTKSTILQALNQIKSDRQKLETLFPKAIHPTQNLSTTLIDRFTWVAVLATIVGARLGHVFFYEWPRYKDHLIDIFKVWEGGLASHGAGIALLIGLFLFQRAHKKDFPELTFLAWVDAVIIPSAFVGFCIRIGNFFNQEILGPETNVPWAVVFGHPIDGTGPIPRHPVQLYEAFVYLITFFFLWGLWRKKAETLKTGTLTGLFMISFFGIRFILEFFKTPSSMMIDESFLQISQYLSIPFILWGIWLCLVNNRCRVQI